MTSSRASPVATPAVRHGLINQRIPAPRQPARNIAKPIAKNSEAVEIDAPERPRPPPGPAGSPNIVTNRIAPKIAASPATHVGVARPAEWRAGAFGAFMIRFNRSASDRAGLSRKESEIHPFDGSSPSAMRSG